MTSGTPKRESPWGVRGVPQEDRSAAALAAKRAGVPLGEWLGRAIRDAASVQLKHTKELGPTTEQMLATLVEQVSNLTRRMDEQQPAAPVVPEAPQQQPGLFARLFGRTSG